LADRNLEGDSVDAAFDAVHDAVSSELAEIESRELTQIERALAQIRRGVYGTCEGCGGKIPVERLNVLPYTTSCIECQRDAEQHGRRSSGYESAGWEKVHDSDSGDALDRVRLADLELDLSRDLR
jgi:DnaK suppressor protein